jgi:hypothetical protein
MFTLFLLSMSNFQIKKLVVDSLNSPSQHLYQKKVSLSVDPVSPHNSQNLIYTEPPKMPRILGLLEEYVPRSFLSAAHPEHPSTPFKSSWQTPQLDFVPLGFPPTSITPALSGNRQIFQGALRIYPAKTACPSPKLHDPTTPSRPSKPPHGRALNYWAGYENSGAIL